MPNFYELTANLAAILQKDELTPEDEVALDAGFASVQAKAASLVAYYREIEHNAAVVASEIRRLTVRKAAMLAKVNGLKKYVLESMLKASLMEISTPLFDVRVQQSPPKVVFDDTQEIPEGFVRESVTEQLDREKAIRLWESGFILPPGLVVEQGFHLVVR